MAYGPLEKPTYNCLSEANCSTEGTVVSLSMALAREISEENFD
jgi:hypothetical protein